MTKELKFMCIGVQKAGTSTLHDILSQNPELNLPIFKETHHFSDLDKFEKGKDYYFNYYFKKRKGVKFYGEIDPEYSFFKESAIRIKSYFPDIKILIILRNPVERAYSHYLMTKRRGLDLLGFEEAITHEQNRLITHGDKSNFSYISRGYYLDIIEEYEHVFGSKNVKVVLFEDLVSITENVIEDISKFFQIPMIQYNYNINSNIASESKSKYLRDFIHRDNKLKFFFGKFIPSKKIKHHIMNFLNQLNLKRTAKDMLKESTKKEIYEKYFKVEIEKLEKKIGKDLTIWKY